ncbi:hypothetical protein AVEN_56944-1 [Araneus ventricosus]|uniref:Uncharacterized protein n=1 Tax=Araneus ventricosus TaxID=182803 RepID=A0A4Y2ERH8_ARAVE|nr:hypothetical protein AVEN_56944-1 [Araneus ventricosus]
MTVTALLIALSSPAFQLALQTKLQSPSSRHVRTPKISPPFGCLRLYTLIEPVVTSHGIILYILHIFSPNRDIEIIAFSGIFDLSPSFSKRSVVRDWAVDGKQSDGSM